MEQKTTELAEIAVRLLDPAFDRVLVACHRSPDGDTVGCAHALTHALRGLGKQARVWCPEPLSGDFAFLTMEEAELPFFQPEHFVTVDVAAPSMLPGADFLERVDVVIDHHRTNAIPGKYRYIDANAAACGEILLELFGAMGVQTDVYIARALYTAIATDTGCFRYSNVTENTFLCAAFLARAVQKGDLYRINKHFFETKSRHRMALESFAATSAEFYCRGKVAYLSVPLSKQEELNASYADLDPLINVIRQVEGVQVALVVKERETGEFRVSVRSEEGFDAASFCNRFGGGGHLAAAGCTVNGDEDEVRNRLLEEIRGRVG